MLNTRRLTLSVALLFCAAAAPGRAQNQVKTLTPAEQPVPPADEGWPRSFGTSNGDTLELYQPQVDSWNGNTIEAHFAIASTLPNASVPVYGVALFTARTDVDKVNRVVYLEEMKFTKITFPSSPEREAQFLSDISQMIPQRSRAISLDRLEMALQANGAAELANKEPLSNKAPKVILSTVPAVLVSINGKPAWRKLKDTDLERVINMSALIVRDTKSKVIYLHLFDGWLSTMTLDSGWAVTTSAPRETVNDLNYVLRALVDSGEADPLEGAPIDPASTAPAPSLLNKPVPVIKIAYTPTELVVTEGAPKWTAIDGTQLSYVNNTTARVFKDAAAKKLYILLAGRWFNADSLGGPWAYISGRALPKDFALIPDSSEVETVKAAVPGTDQAAEAVIANTIPQTSALAKSAAAPTITIDGAPQLKPIDGTNMQYVVNASRPVIRLSDNTYYACANGAWLAGPSATGPWALAGSVPSDIYLIPPSSPLHYVTFVKVYQATDDTIFVGYTNGYTGAIVGDDGTVVYGTGYDYDSWVGDEWYAPLDTYGYGANIGWTPWYGWRYGAGYGYAMGWGGYGVGSYRGVGRWGAGNWGVSTGNVYDSWLPRAALYNNTRGFDAITTNRWYDRAAVSYNSRTGIATAGNRWAVGNAFTGSYASGTRGVAYDARTGRAVSYGAGIGPNGGYARVGNTVFGDRNGNTFRYNGDRGWQQNNGRAGWGNMSNGRSTGGLNNQRVARDRGEARTGGFQRSGGPRAAGFSGGFRGGRRR